MATKDQLAKARELLDLDVREVSLVDRPANLRPFLIVKRQTEDHLGEFEIEPSVVEWLEKVAVSPGAPTESIRALTAVLAGGEPVDPKQETKDQAEDQAVDQNATAAEPTAEPVTKTEPAAEPETVTEAEPAAEPVAKNEPMAEPDPDDQPMVVIKRDGSIHVSGQQVQKAKTFGKAKTATLQNAVSALAKLLGDVSEDALKAAMLPYSDPTKKVDTTKAVDPEQTNTADPIELITKAVASALEPITKRLDEIEKTRNPSQSVEGDGGTESRQTKVNKSIWAGVL